MEVQTQTILAPRHLDGAATAGLTGLCLHRRLPRCRDAATAGLDNQGAQHASRHYSLPLASHTPTPWQCYHCWHCQPSSQFTTRLAGQEKQHAPRCLVDAVATSLDDQGPHHASHHHSSPLALPAKSSSTHPGISEMLLPLTSTARGRTTPHVTTVCRSLASPAKRRSTNPAILGMLTLLALPPATTVHRTPFHPREVAHTQPSRERRRRWPQQPGGTPHTPPPQFAARLAS